MTMYVIVIDSIAVSVSRCIEKKPNPVKGPTLRSLADTISNLKIKNKKL